MPTIKQATGSNWTMAAWRGIAAPKGLPKDVETSLVAAIKKICDSKEYKDFLASRGFGVIWAPPEEFAKFMAKSRRRHGRGDEGGRHGQVTSRRASRRDRRTR